MKILGKGIYICKDKSHSESIKVKETKPFWSLKLPFTVKTCNVKEAKNGKVWITHKAKCKLVFADSHDTLEDILKQVRKIVEYYGLKTYQLDIDGFLAMAIGLPDFTKEDAEKELDKHRVK